MLRILVVDDNRSSADALARILRKQGHDVVAAYEGQRAIEHIAAERFALVLTDLKMEPVDGMQVLRAARLHQPPVEVIVFTAFGGVEKAVEAMQLGARDFLTKPVSVDQILERIRQLSGDAEPAVDPHAPIVANSVGARRLLSTLEAVADVPSPVWLEGEVGTGRLEAARLLHDYGEGELPYTIVDPAGSEPLPTRGTVVLPGLDELDDATQQSLMRRLRAAPPGARFVATSLPDARARVASGALRGELYFAFAVVIVSIPPLRQRPEDVVPLFERALTRFCEKYGRDVPTLTDEHRALLVRHGWPGNLRELNNLAERTAVLGFSLEMAAQDGGELGRSPGGEPRRGGESGRAAESVLGPGFRLAEHLEAIERAILVDALRQADGDRNVAGRLLGVERNTLRYKLNKYGLLDA